MSAQVEPNFKTNVGDCECGCGAYGTLKKPWKSNGKRCVARRCRCKRCVGKTSRSTGDKAGRKVRQLLGLSGANTRHEEGWGGPVRTESKAGAIARPVLTKHALVKAQSEQSRPLGDNRPFMGSFTDAGRTVFTIDEDSLEAVVASLAVSWGIAS